MMMRKPLSPAEKILLFLQFDRRQLFILLLMPIPVIAFVAYWFHLPWQNIVLQILSIILAVSYYDKALRWLEPIKEKTYIKFCDRYGWKMGVLAAAGAQVLEYVALGTIVIYTLYKFGAFPMNGILFMAIVALVLVSGLGLVFATYMNIILRAKKWIVLDIQNNPILTHGLGDLYVYSDLTERFFLVNSWKRGNGVVMYYPPTGNPIVTAGYRTKFQPRKLRN